MINRSVLTLAEPRRFTCALRYENEPFTECMRLFFVIDSIDCTLHPETYVVILSLVLTQSRIVASGNLCRRAISATVTFRTSSSSNSFTLKSFE
jgi:hypothetical protein